MRDPPNAGLCNGLPTDDNRRCARFLHVRIPSREKHAPPQAQATMTARRTNTFEQKLIDHEVRVSEAREIGERHVAGRDVRRERTSSQADRRWYRRELVDMLTAARTEDDLRELGLSDEVVREAGLGDSLMEAWARFRGPHHAPSSPFPAEPAHQPDPASAEVAPS